MLQFKTVAVPAAMLQVKESEMYTLNTANMAIAPVALTIQEHARAGWHLHSCTMIPAHIQRKRSFWEILFGWIPIINMVWAHKENLIEPVYYVVIFQRDAQ